MAGEGALLLALVFFGSAPYHATHPPTEAEPGEPRPLVFLTVSSLASRANDVQDRILEMNWENIPPDDEETWIELLADDPDTPQQPLVAIKPGPAGYHRTGVRLPEMTFTEQNLSDSCLGFWIAYRRQGAIRTANCLRARPHWMWELRQSLANLSLVEMMIPGTHNAGSYAPFRREEDNVLNRYLLTQEEEVWNQLVYGIRYLDLRVAYHRPPDSEEAFWITHSSFRTDLPVTEVLSQVGRFLNATREIVILDFHRFVDGFQGPESEGRHRELVALLHAELGELMVPAGFTPWVTLGSLWHTGKRLYVGYADGRTREQDSDRLFPAVRHQWGDVDRVRDLSAYLNRTVCVRRRRGLTSAMAQLTPTTVGAIFDLYGGLRSMADAVNRHVTRWFRDRWAGCANIVATDYFLGNNVIEVAIGENGRRSPLPGSAFS